MCQLFEAASLIDLRAWSAISPVRLEPELPWSEVENGTWPSKRRNGLHSAQGLQLALPTETPNAELDVIDGGFGTVPTLGLERRGYGVKQKRLPRFLR